LILIYSLYRKKSTMPISSHPINHLRPEMKRPCFDLCASSRSKQCPPLCSSHISLRTRNHNFVVTNKSYPYWEKSHSCNSSHGPKMKMSIGGKPNHRRKKKIANASVNWSPRHAPVTRKIKIRHWFFLPDPTWRAGKSGDN
jgi:hypothetical protein